MHNFLLRKTRDECENCKHRNIIISLSLSQEKHKSIIQAAVVHNNQWHTCGVPQFPCRLVWICVPKVAITSEAMMHS